MFPSSKSSLLPMSELESERKKRRMTFIVVAVAVVSLVALAGVIVSKSKPEDWKDLTAQVLPNVVADNVLDPSAHGSGVVKVKCPSGYSVTSCGIINYVTQLEKFWQVQPFSQGCTCYNYFGVKCVATCVPSSEMQNQQIVAKPFSGNAVAVCPSGLKLTGCGMGNTFGGYEPYKQVYPVSTTACHCYNYFGGTCYAICASSVQSSQVVTRSGSGAVYATCPNGKKALGCGFQIPAHGPAEAFPSFHAAGPTSCVGYSYFGVTTYALCGELEGPTAALEPVTVMRTITPDDAGKWEDVVIDEKDTMKH